MKNILHTRLIRPKSKNIIRRNNNIESKLSEILNNKLTVVKGGAAVGKSSLISSYIENKNNYMWLSLDESCNDLAYFWTYILHGLKNNIEDLNFYIDMITLLVNREDIFELISSLINELISEEILFIIMDDFHYINDKFIIETIENFIFNSSDNVHFILISRRDIPIYLGNILMKGGVVDISGEDFYLNLEETKEFIKNSSNKVINDELIEEIYLNTEGWIGAIKLLLTVLYSKKNIKNIPKSNKLFIDYINKEIIHSLSKEEMDFLVRTSPLSYVNPMIYKEIYNIDGFKIIRRLIEKNMLIITIDEEGGIFRYHNILRQHLIEIFSEYEENLKNKVIDSLTLYLMNEGNYDEAISILLKWNRYYDALKILEKNAHNIVSTKIINDFPLEYYSKSMDLTIISIFFNYLNLDYERCGLIITSLEKTSNPELLNFIKFFNIIIDNSSIEDLCFELPDEIDSNLNILTRIIYYLLYSVISRFLAEYKKGLEVLDKIKSLNKELNNSYFELLCEYNRVSLLEDMGKLNDSEIIFNKLNKSISNKNYKICFDIFRSVGLPGIYIKQLRAKEADTLLIEAQGILKNLKGKAAFSSVERSIEYNLAEVKFIQGNIDECEKILNHMIKESKENYSHIEMLALRIRLLSTVDRISKKEYEEFIDTYKENYNKYTHLDKSGLTYGIVLFNLGRYEDSLESFNKVIFIARKNNIGYLLVYALLWKVILLNKIKMDSNREVINILKEAIFYSRDEEILFPYYINRRYLKDIINMFKKELIQEKDNNEFIKKINNFIEIEDEKDILSSREIEVLKYLTDGLSNKEIGNKLFISVSTVKTHIINIYSKLQVKNRVEAVNAGRKKGIV